MARYRFSFTQDEYGYVYFDAESKQGAEDLLSEVRDGYLDVENLPKVYVKYKDGGTTYEHLEEVE